MKGHNYNISCKKCGKIHKHPIKGKYIWRNRNHPCIGIPRTKEVKLKLSISHAGKILSEEHKKKISTSNRGKKSWNKGLTKQNNERIKKIGRKISQNKERNLKVSITRKKLFKEGKLINHFKGKHHSEETKKRLRNIRKGKYLGKNNPMYDIHRWAELNPNWKGGLSFIPYTQEFNKQIKDLIKKRDKHKCFLCKTKNNLCIHHINYIKEDCRPENLITLCISCNSKVNAKRKEWEDYFNGKCI